MQGYLVLLYYKGVGQEVALKLPVIATYTHGMAMW